MGRRIFLVSCVSSKNDRPAPAADLYRSPWFGKAKAYVQTQAEPWLILSAEHGLVEPDRVIAPYERTLNHMPVAERRAWSREVLESLEPCLGEKPTVVFLAGQRYRQFLVPALEARGIRVEVPMAGLGIGEQLAWLDRQRLGDRVADLRRFYELLDELSRRTGGRRQLDQGRGPIPRDARGIYFFFEPGELRSDSGTGPRVTRVGTHALVREAKSTLWKRLAQHRGRARTPGGNHRGSVFRLLVGKALIQRDGLACPTWASGSSASRSTRELEASLEAKVSGHVQAMPYLWLIVGDEPGPKSIRGHLERNAIALLSNWEKNPIDPPSKAWLGWHSHKETVRESGLWNSNHVDESYDPAFLDVLAKCVSKMEGIGT